VKNERRLHSVNSKEVSLERLLTRATEQARKSVAAVAEAGSRALVVGTGAAGDKTLLADLRAEQELTKVLLQIDGVRILSEEAGEIGDPMSRTLAVVDPLDGSSNFERELPFYCTSIGITEERDLAGIRLAMVRNLVNGDNFFAVRGGGASKNGNEIRTAKVRSLEESVLDVDASGTTEVEATRLVPLISAAKRIVHFGANALELCLLAEGKVDALVDLRGKMRITDITGGYLIAKEAGAIISLREIPQSAPIFDLDTRFNLVASANRSLHGEIMRALRSKHFP